MDDNTKRLIAELNGAKQMALYWSNKDNEVAVSNWVTRVVTLQGQLAHEMSRLRAFAQKQSDSKVAHNCFLTAEEIYKVL